MDEVKAWRTSDGHVTTSFVEATNRQRDLDFKEAYEDHVCYGRWEGSRIEAEDMLKWIRENESIIAPLLESIKSDVQ